MDTTKKTMSVANKESRFSSFLTFKLDLIKSEMISRANAVYKPACGLDVRSLRVLRVICDTPGITATTVRERTLIEKTLLSKLMANLFERKLLRRTVHPEDGRHFQLWPTAAGERMRASSDKLGHAMEAEMLSILSPDEHAALDGILNKLVEALSASTEVES